MTNEQKPKIRLVPQELENEPFEDFDCPTYVFTKEDAALQDTITSSSSGPSIEDLKSKPKKVNKIARESVFKRLESFGKDLQGPDERFKIKGLIGKGGSAMVYEVRDANLDRNVAVKIFRDADLELPNFIKEGQVSAQLDHPNIVPIYDIDVDNNGNTCLTMKQVKGHSLKNYIENKLLDKEDPYIKSADDLVRVMLKVCDALEFAHDKGKIHQDVKPENIMLGKFGEVFLIDWGASLYSEECIKATPSYMSPQQAMREEPAITDDVFCVGATFYHALTGCFLNKVKSFKELWEKRVKGIIDPLPEDLLADVPSPLLAIALKAMECEPEDRYQNIGKMVKDFENYQEGRAISAYRDNFWNFCKRWYGRNRHFFWSTFIILVLTLGFGSMFYQLKLKEIAHWGKPIYTEDFSDKKWEKQWIPFSGKWQHRDGRLVTGKGTSFFIFYKERLDGNVAIEFDGEMEPGCPPCDLSVVWMEDIYDKNGELLKKPDYAYLFQLGANDNNYAKIMRIHGARFDYKDLKLEHGVKYHIRVEIEGQRLAILLNGKLLCEGFTNFSTDSGYIGLYGYYEGKAFDNIKIYNKGVPEKISVINLGDLLYKKKQFADAIKQYDQVIRSLPGSLLEKEAIYKKGLALYQLTEQNPDLKKEAWKVWKKLLKTPFESKILVYLWEEMYSNGEKEKMLTDVKRSYLKADAQGRKEIEKAFWVIGSLAVHDMDYPTLRKLVDLQYELFPGNRLFSGFRTGNLIMMGEVQELLKNPPKERWEHCQVLLQAGKYDEAIENYQDLRFLLAYTYVSLGEYEKVLKDYRNLKDPCARALFNQGKFAEVKKQFPEVKDVMADILIIEGKPEQVLKLYPKETPNCVKALMFMDQPEKVLANYSKETGIDQALRQAEHQIAYRDLLNGRTDKGMKKIALLRKKPFDYLNWHDLIFDYFIFPTFLDCLEGKEPPEKAFGEMMQQNPYRMAKRIWFRAAFMAGKINDKEFMAQRNKISIDGDFILCQAMKAELAKKPAAAAKLYQKYLKTPLHLRGINSSKDTFVKWRLKEINKGK